MDLCQFEEHLDRYGANLSDWPAELRGPASALTAVSAPARAAWHTMGAIEEVLRATSSEANAAGAAQALAARAMRHRQDRPVPAVARRAAWASAASAALVLGLFVGGWAPWHRDDSPSSVMAAAFDMPGEFDVE